jgi:hypothetical protein
MDDQVNENALQKEPNPGTDYTDAHRSAGETAAAVVEERSAFERLIASDKNARAELDRRLGKAVETAKGKWETDAAARIEAVKTEAEKLAAMTADQRIAHERKQREDDLTARERELIRRELRGTAADTLRERDLPIELLDVLDYANADATHASIEKIEKALRDEVQRAVTQLMRGQAPKAPQASRDDQDNELRRRMGLPPKKT